MYVTSDGEASVAGSAPYLDFEPTAEDSAAEPARYGWLADGEAAATQWIVESELPEYADTVRTRVQADVERTRMAVTGRLQAEINRLYSEAGKVSEDEAAGRKVRIRSATVVRRAQDLEVRLARRLRDLELDARLTLKPPHVLGAALVLSRSTTEGSEPSRPPAHAKETKEVEQRAVRAVLAAECVLGRKPEEMPPNNPGYDIRSTTSDGHLIHLEVKGRLSGADDFFVTFNEVLHGKNAAPRYRLALVSVHPDGAAGDEIRYLGDPFARISIQDFAATGIRASWDAEWARGQTPF